MPLLFKAARAVLVLLVLLPALVRADDPPARVGRLAYIENGVEFRVGRDDAGEPATINWPISNGAELDTDSRGRAEVWVGSTAFRLAGSSRAEFAVVDDRQVVIRLSEGSLAVSILDRDQADNVTVQTPDGDIRFVTPGRYRVNVLLDYSELSAQAGQAQIDDRGRITPVGAGQKGSLLGGGRVQVAGDFNHDAFDNWVANRENATMADTSRHYVSSQMTGYEDLDAYGDWRTAPEYGSVWYPRTVADDWAPYRYGRWAWVEPWGWTWVDEAPWGFAPFHYGRWAVIQSRWAWVPGRVESRPVYAPALVGWVGNPGWNVNFRAGAAPAVGWFPLAPREVFVPGYRHSAGYVRQLNISHVRDVNIIDRAVRGGPPEAFAHQDNVRAVTVVPANLLREGRPITAREIRPHDRQELGRAPQAVRAPGSEWLAPTPRPLSEVRREGGRDAGLPFRRSELPPPNDSIRELRDSQRLDRQAPRDTSPPVFRFQERAQQPPVPREVESPVRHAEPPVIPQLRQEVPPARREIREERQPASPAFRPLEAPTPRPALPIPQPAPQLVRPSEPPRTAPPSILPLEQRGGPRDNQKRGEKDEEHGRAPR